MNSDHSRLEAIFDAALTLTATERDAFLAERCAGDDELLAKVRKLLAAHSEAATFLETPASPAIEAQLAALKPEEAGDRIGPYKLLQQIGEGGFGTVWMAEQEEPVRRRVALKIIKLGMDTREVIARFEQERQALAMMDHPNIAKVHDAGATQFGRPYFVMELVRGKRITDFCDEAALGTRERLALFMQVCHAVQHAHQKGVIHRDIKPSNILVAMHDDAPVPKVIDFGVAKATQQPLTDKTLFTRFEQMVGTPLYMSPEQAGGELDIDTRADTYALGVLLYELLTGRTPFDADALMRAGFEEMRRVIREQEPPKPSTALSTMEKGALTTIAHHRHIEPPKLISAVRGDLDWIVMKALEKDRRRRYATTSDLAADIERHLRNEPITAHPPSTAYLLGKLIRRHKVAFAAGAAVALALVLGIIGTTWQAHRADVNARAEKKAKEQAQTEAAINETVNGFITNLFGSASPNVQPDRDLKVQTLLDRGVASMGNRFQDQPLVEASILLTFANAYWGLGEFEQSRKLAGRSAELRRGILGPDHLSTLISRMTIAATLGGLGKHSEAETEVQNVMEACNKSLGPEHPGTLRAMNLLATSLYNGGHKDEALKLGEELLSLSRKVNGPEHEETLLAMQNLATYYVFTNRRDEAFPLLEKVLQLSREVRGIEHPNTLKVMGSLVAYHCEAGNPEDALKLGEEVLPLSRKINGPEHPSTLKAMNNLGAIYVAVGRVEDAIKLQEELLALRRTIFGAEHRETLNSIMNLAVSYGKTGRLEEELKLREEALSLSRKINTSEHTDTLENMNRLANLYSNADRQSDSLKLREEALPLSRKVFGPEDRNTLGAMTNLAISYFQAGQRREAIKLQEESLAIKRRVLAPNDPYLSVALGNLANFYESELRLDEANKLWAERDALRKKK